MSRLVLVYGEGISIKSGETDMQDALFVTVTIVFFIASIGYVRFCERVK
jgi:hypothetical protein